MQYNVVKVESGSAIFHVTGTDNVKLNKLRRILLSRIETLAIDSIYIESNTSVFPDEFLAVRLGLVPIRLIDATVTEVPEMTFTLNVLCENKLCIVTTDKLVPSEEAAVTWMGDIELLKLNRGQEINISCIAKVGNGQMNAKWNPVTRFYYSEVTATRQTRSGPVVENNGYNCTLTVKIPHDPELIFKEAVEIFNEEEVE